ncbi:hypothetical protein [Spirosoma horti]
MKTTAGIIRFHFTSVGDRASYFTMLRTYRQQLLYYHGSVFPDFNTDGSLLLTKKARFRYENEYFLKHAERLSVDPILLYNAFMPCLNWKHLVDTRITHDGTNWELTLQLNDACRSFGHDTNTGEFDEWVSHLELILHRPLVASGVYY